MRTHAPFLALALVGAAAAPAHAAPPTVIAGLGPQGAPAAEQPGRYGGGFIEFLMSGGHGRAPARPAMAAVGPDGGEPDGFEAVYAPQAPMPGFEPAQAPAPRPVPGYAMPRKQLDPMFLRQEVAFAGRQAPGTVVIDTHSKFLYLVEGEGRALRYGIGVGRPGFLWTGEKTITRKAEWPDWVPPAEMLQRRPDLPRHMEGGIANPLGARAMYLGSTLYRIHGTNEPDTIGTNVSSGCIRLTNDDVSDLYTRVDVGTHVVVL